MTNTGNGQSKVLLTGGGGYLARHIIEELQGSYALTLTDRQEPADCLGLPFVRADITASEEVKTAVAGHDTIVHTAAIVRERFETPVAVFADVMVKGYWHLLEAAVAAGVKRIINTSTVIAAGWPGTLDHAYQVGEGNHYHTSDLHYPIAKQLAESMGAAYAQAHGLVVLNLRPGIIARDGVNAEPQPPSPPAAHWFAHVDPRDMAHAVERALATPFEPGACRTYQIVAGRADALFDWRPAAQEIGYRPQWNWPEIAGGAL